MSDYGVVLSYIGYVESTNTRTDTTSEQTLEINALTNYQKGSVTLESFPTDPGLGFGDLSTASTGLLFRYVIVPGSVLATTKLTPQQLKSMSYPLVTRLLRPAANSAAPPTF